MKLQTATRLALYAALDLAAEPERQMSVGEIAEKYGVSTNHLAKVLRELGRAKLVEAARGVGGGYRFAGNAKRVTLMDVVGLFEDVRTGPPRAAETGRPGAVASALSLVLAEIEATTVATLSSITLDTMLKLRRRHAAAPAPTVTAGAVRAAE